MPLPNKKSVEHMNMVCMQTTLANEGAFFRVRYVSAFFTTPSKPSAIPRIMHTMHLKL